MSKYDQSQIAFVSINRFYTSIRFLVLSELSPPRTLPLVFRQSIAVQRSGSLWHATVSSIVLNVVVPANHNHQVHCIIKPNMR